MSSIDEAPIDAPATYISSIQSMSKNGLSWLWQGLRSASGDHSDALRNLPTIVRPRSKFHRRSDGDAVGTVRRALETKNRHRLI
ncbi:hypothetical protein ACHMW4_30235 [Mesorhizobium sp. UC22_110]|uniref:hypothetical protein n=1 Tax=unclassified Mesorhizobium TaxID=325217 RepID=UPI003672264A